MEGNGSNLLGVSITFTDLTRCYQLQEELGRSNQELETAYEELQSTNEELETMNEELQSTNEQSKTMNEELRLRTDELNSANTFQQSILTSLRGGVVVVDHRFKVIIWNHGAEDMWGLRADEVEGQPFLNLDIGLSVECSRAPMQACLTEEVESQEVTLEAVNRRGKTIQCHIACTPLTDPEGERQGVILLMEES